MIPSFIRLLRFTGLFIAIFAPALYIAMISFHYEVIPLKLLLTIENLEPKFLSILEALLMELVLEMLREAAIRLPKFRWTNNRRRRRNCNWTSCGSSWDC